MYFVTAKNMDRLTPWADIFDSPLVPVISPVPEDYFVQLERGGAIRSHKIYRIDAGRLDNVDKMRLASHILHTDQKVLDVFQALERVQGGVEVSADGLVVVQLFINP